MQCAAAHFAICPGETLSFWQAPPRAWCANSLPLRAMAHCRNASHCHTRRNASHCTVHTRTAQAAGLPHVVTLHVRECSAASKCANRSGIPLSGYLAGSTASRGSQDVHAAQCDQTAWFPICM
jgi:hypothetical protein